MHVAVCELTIHLAGVRSLKEKRKAMRRIIDRTRHAFNVSIAETDLLDVHDRGKVGFCAVANDTRFLNSVVDKICTFIQELYVAEIVSREVDYLVYGED